MKKFKFDCRFSFSVFGLPLVTDSNTYIYRDSIWSVYFHSKRCLKCDQRNHYNCLRHLSPSLAETKPLCAPPYLYYSYPYLTNGPHTDTQSSYTSIAPAWTNTHINGTGLDLFTAVHLPWKTQHIKKGERDPFFANEMKGLCCSDLSKQGKVQRWVRLLGDFFTVFPLKLHGRKEEYKECEQVILDSWDIEKMINIFRERETGGQSEALLLPNVLILNS